MIKYIVLILFSFSVSAQKAFPTAKGAGASATGGRGGTVLHVTNLNWNSSTGSLKWALEQTYPRIIVFDVSGTIDATSEARFTPFITNSNCSDVTIAGQTAPDDGITINVSEFYMENVSNMIWRYVRFRKTFAFPTGGGSFPDRDVALFRLGSNIIFDHCTFSAGNDECLDLADTFGDVTVQNCFFQDSKTGILMGTWTGEGDFTLVDNLFTNTSHRFPNTKDGGSYDIINNVVYNWKNRLVNISGLDDTVRANVINNYYKPADDGLRGVGWYGAQIGIMNLQKWQRHSGDDILVYTSGNVIEGDPRFDPAQSDNTGMWSYFTASDPQYTDGSLVDPVLFTGTQFAILGQTYSIKTATDAYTEVLSDVGANRTLNADGTWSENQDTRDYNLISEIENDTWTRPIPSDFTYPLHGDIPVIPISSSSRPVGYDTDNDGIPDAYEIAQGWNPNVANDDVVDASGYTQLELFLNEVDSENATPPTQSGSLSKKAKSFIIRQ